MGKQWANLHLLFMQGLPTLLLFKEGKVVDRIEGVMDQRSLSHRLRYYMRGLQSKFGRSQ